MHRVGARTPVWHARIHSKLASDRVRYTCADGEAVSMSKCTQQQQHRLIIIIGYHTHKTRHKHIDVGNNYEARVEEREREKSKRDWLKVVISSGALSS